MIMGIYKNELKCSRGDNPIDAIENVFLERIIIIVSDEPSASPSLITTGNLPTKIILGFNLNQSVSAKLRIIRKEINYEIEKF